MTAVDGMRIEFGSDTLPGAETSQCWGGGGVSSTPILCWATLRQPEPTSLSADLQDLQLLLGSVMLTLERYRTTEVLANVVKVIALPSMHSFNYSLAN